MAPPFPAGSRLLPMSLLSHCFQMSPWLELCLAWARRTTVPEAAGGSYCPRDEHPSPPPQPLHCTHPM